MSKITNDGLTRSGTECCIAVPIWQQWAGHQRVNSRTCCLTVTLAISVLPRHVFKHNC